MDKIFFELIEEQKRNSRKQEQLKRIIKDTVCGDIFSKRRGAKEYYYHVFTEDGERTMKYLGKDKEGLQEKLNEIEKRKHMERELKQLKSDQKALDEMLVIVNKRIESRDTTPREKINALKGIQATERTKSSQTPETSLPEIPLPDLPKIPKAPNQNLT